MNKKKAIFVFFIIVAIIISIILIFEYIRANEEVPEVTVTVPSVITEKAVEDEFTLSYEVTGKLMSNEYRIGADVIRNKVSKIYVKEGDHVKAGDAILSVDMTSSVSQLKLQIINLDQAINDLDLSLNQLSKKREDLLALLDAGLVSQNKLEELDDNIEKLTVKKEGLFNNRKALINEKHSINRLGIIYSKEDGIVSKIKLKKNQYPLMTDYIEIKKEEKNKIRIYLTEKIMKKISVSDQVEIKVDDEVYTGMIDEIYSLSQGEILYPVDITFDADKEFISGSSAQIKIPIYHNEKAILVSRKAIIQFNDEVYLYKLIDNKAVKTLITIGETADSMTEVFDGINKGDEIITEGQFNIVNNEKVQVINNN